MLFDADRDRQGQPQGILFRNGLVLEIQLASNSLVKEGVKRSIIMDRTKHQYNEKSSSMFMIQPRIIYIRMPPIIDTNPHVNLSRIANDRV